MRLNLRLIAGLSLVAFLIVILYPTGYMESLVEEEKNNRKDPVERCDLFSGVWIYDNESYPLYKGTQCSFIEDEYACEKYGRKNLDYQNWRWQPNDCDLPRFNGTEFLEKIRGKKLIFVGDSLNRNQFHSMLCLIESSLPPSTSKSLIWKGNFIVFHATDYNATINFYWSPLLVESNCDDIMDHRGQHNRIIRFNAIEKHARQWTDADILIFDSFMWWLEPTMTLLWGSFGSSDAIYKKVEMRLRRYELTIRTWSDWLDIHINRTRTKLFFMSLSPFHNLGDDWGQAIGENCYNESEPVLNKTYWGSSTDRGTMQIIESAIHELGSRGVKVDYLNITQLSDYRKDAHSSIYRKFWTPQTEEQLSNPKSYADCVHWCLPGVPDVWNQILYAHIVQS